MALLVTGLIGLAVWPKPTYQGRTLDEWLASPVLFTNTTSAFHEAGPHGLKMLLGEVGKQESAWKYQAGRFRDWLDDRGWWKRSRPGWLAAPWWRVHNAYWVLRSYSTVDPELLPMLTEQLMTAVRYCDPNGLSGTSLNRAAMEIQFLRQQRMQAILILISKAGPPGTTTLTNMLGLATNRYAVTAIIGAIASQGEAGASAAPALVKLADDPRLVPLVTFALGEIHGDFELSRPLLLSAATNGNPNAIYALGNYGAAMRPWLPQLSVVSNHHDLNVRYHWNIAAEKILRR